MPNKNEKVLPSILLLLALPVILTGCDRPEPGDQPTTTSGAVTTSGSQVLSEEGKPLGIVRLPTSCDAEVQAALNEVNNILGVIIGNAHLAKKNLSSPEAVERYIGEVREAAEDGRETPGREPVSVISWKARANRAKSARIWRSGLRAIQRLAACSDVKKRTCWQNEVQTLFASGGSLP